MENILKKNFEKYLKAQYGPTIVSLEKAFFKFGIDYFLIGALSRDLWLQHLNDLPPYRMTTDIDFAILVNDEQQYREIIKYLIETEKFLEDPESYRLHAPSGVIVDLIPFGKIEKNNEVRIKGKKWTYLTVLGTKEVTEMSVKMDGNFQVITLPGLCILKLIAWLDNPGIRERDVSDFTYLLYHYFTIAGEEIYADKVNDWFADPFNEKIIGARYLGQQILKILEKNDFMKAKILASLQKQLDKFTQEEIDKMFQNNKDDFKIVVYKLITEVIEAIQKE